MRWHGILILVFTFCWSFGQRDFDNVQIKATAVAGSVYILEGEGGNIGVSAGEDGILIVDDQFAPLAQKIQAALDQISTGELKFILNTHWHGDHTGGNQIFGREAPIIAHSNVRKRLSSEQRRGDRITPPSPKEAWPVITFDHSVSLHFNNEEIRVIHFPQGHTDGDSVIFFTGSNVVHMGDHFFRGRFPFVDTDSGGSVEGYLKNVEAVIAQLPSDVKIIPGHGALATLEDLKDFQKMLSGTIGFVKRQKQSGRSLEDVKAEGLPASWKEWSNPASSSGNEQAWIEKLYSNLTP